MDVKVGLVHVPLVASQPCKASFCIVLQIAVAEHSEFLQADNFFVDIDGDWWLGDFGSTIKTSEPILSTTQLFNPGRSLLGTPAMPQHDWDMLAVAFKKKFQSIPVLGRLP